MANKRKIQEINAGSMADIAFLLLIFFLVATTMTVDTGLNRVLPPMPEENQTVDPLKINERNVMLVFISRFDNIMVGREGTDLSQLKDKTKRFILNMADEEDLPEKEMTQIDLIGNYPVSKGVVSLQNDRGTSYDMYIKVQNELTRAFNEVRDEVAMAKFGRNFLDCNEEQRSAIQKAVPLKISEAEPRNIEGGQ